MLSGQAINAIVLLATYPVALFDGTAKFLLFTVVPAGLPPPDVSGPGHWLDPRRAGYNGDAGPGAIPGTGPSPPSPHKDTAMQSDVDILASARLFEALPRPAVERLAERSQHRHFGAGERVFDEGDPGAALYVVAEGEIRIDIASPAGEHVTLVFLGPGEAFGELALLDDAPRSAEAVATEASTLLSLYRKDFYSILEDEPEAVRALLGTLAGYVRNTNQRLADAAFLDVPGRMAKALKTLADRYGKQTPDGILLDHELTPSVFAGLTGLHESFVRKLLQDYQYDSVLMVDGDRITIHRPQVLDRWLEGGAVS